MPPVYTAPDDTPGAASPMIIAESGTHVVIALEISRIELARHRRFLESLLAVATPTPSADDE
jgi:hypothetical protein